jgi:hypothetical protein
MKDTARSSRFFYVKTQLGWFVMFSDAPLFVCTTCFSLSSLGLGMQRCMCEGHKSYAGVDCPSGFILCYICAATVTGGTSRYSWNACESCLKFNLYVGRTYGLTLPLGRHSIMNSISVPLRASEEVQAAGIEAMVKFVKASGALSDWGKLQARQLFESAHAWGKEGQIPQATWEAKFHLSGVKATSRSEQAFKDYLRVNAFKDLS